MSAGALAAGGAVVAAVLAAVELLAVRRAQRRARAGRRARLPAVLLATLTRVGRPLGVAPPPDALERRLAAAGAPPSVRPADVMAAKTGLALVAVLATAAPATALPGRLAPVVLVAAPIAGALLPDAWLRRRARLRAHAMAREVADVLDLLRVCVQAGRSPDAALAEVGRRHRGALGHELRRAAVEFQLGQPRAEVLRTLALRCPLAEIGALTAALRRADRHGAPLAPALTALAADARAARARAVREQAAKAAPKIQLVVALLLVPAVLLLVGAALAAAFGVS